MADRRSPAAGKQARLGVVIPAIDEAGTLPDLLQDSCRTRCARRGRRGGRGLVGRYGAGGARRRGHGAQERTGPGTPDERGRSLPPHPLAPHAARRLPAGPSRTARDRGPPRGRRPRRGVLRPRLRPRPLLLPPDRECAAGSRAPHRPRVRRPGPPDSARPVLRGGPLPRRADHGGRDSEPAPAARGTAAAAPRHYHHQPPPLRRGGPRPGVGPQRDSDHAVSAGREAGPTRRQVQAAQRFAPARGARTRSPGRPPRDGARVRQGPPRRPGEDPAGLQRGRRGRDRHLPANGPRGDRPAGGGYGRRLRSATTPAEPRTRCGHGWETRPSVTGPSRTATSGGGCGRCSIGPSKWPIGRW